MSILKGLKTAGLFLLLLAMGLYLIGRFVDAPLDLGVFPGLLLAAVPCAAGLSAGYSGQRRAWRAGLWLGCILWLLQFLFLFWFLPALLNWGGQLLCLAYVVFSSCIFAILGLNLRLTKPVRNGNME